MVILDLELGGFRNYSRAKAEFSPRLNLIVGRNGQGKTNLVEALHYVCNLDSFRTRKLATLLKDQGESASIAANVDRAGVRHGIRIGLSRSGRQVMLDHSPARRTSEYIHSFFSLLFTPEDVNLFRSSPADRRRFFDRAISFVAPSYFKDLQELQGVLAQKNHLLRTRGHSQLPLFNELLAKVSLRLHDRRLAFCEEINRELTSVFAKVTGRTDTLELRYQPNLQPLIIPDPKKKTATVSPENSAEGETSGGCDPRLQAALEKFGAMVMREEHAGHALIGPQRDDYQLLMDGRPDKEFFSQGEHRAANLTLKMVINQLFSERYNFLPVLLFDDLFSELDQGVAGRMSEYFLSLENQIFITSTEMPGELRSRGRIFEVSEGALKVVVEAGGVAPLPAGSEI